MSQGKKKDPDKIRSRFSEVQNITDKQMLVFCKSVFHFSEAENDSALTLLSNRKIPEGAVRIDYLDYMEGIARMNKLDWSAERYFLRYIQNFPGRSYELSAWQRIAWIHLLKNDMEGYKKYIARCTDPSKGKDLTDDDRLAITEAKTGRIPNSQLLRCRLLFDGGYYQLAMKEWSMLKTSDLKSKADQLEHGYRLARIYDKTGQTKNAIAQYELTVRNGSDEPYYYAANSALLLGQLYEDRGNYPLAAQWFKRAQDFEETEYRFSIEQKARAGLSRVESKLK
jgi:tetratricopeptide (TPR) repeat protein